METRGGRRWTLAASLLFAALALAPAAAQDTSLEKIEAVDPYTKGDKAALQRAGYVSLGPFHWAESHSTSDVQQVLGGIPVIFIETAHFRLASTLESYKLTDDPIEKRAIAAEIAELAKKLPKAKATQKVDPWLRAHLYAQRLEQLYADFCVRFGITENDFKDAQHQAERGVAMGDGPFLGQKDKFVVLLSQTRSGLGRYLHTYVHVENDYAYRYQFSDCAFYGANFEALKDASRGFDVALYAGLAASLAQNFVDAFRASYAAAPVWLRYGVAHSFARKIDPRWNQWGAGGDANPDESDTWHWEPRVLGLVKNDACGSWDAMLKWKTLDDLKPRDHMIAWSRVEWLMTRKPEERRALLFALTEPLEGDDAQRAAAQLERQPQALRKALGQDPAALDAAWRAWVAKTYRD